MSGIRILVVDDHAIVREGLRSLLELADDVEAVAGASSSKECFEMLTKDTYDIILMDLKMPGIDGIEATRLIKKTYPHIKVVILTNYDDAEYVLESIKAGSDGYVLKDVNKGDLIKIVRTVVHNQSFIAPEVTGKVFLGLKEGAKTSSSQDHFRAILSYRELEILSFVVNGMANKEIAEAVCLSADTVKTHLKKIYKKLGVSSRSQAIKIALQEGLVHFSR
ncbi:MAG: Oxygen regulatory protein NreC [Smithella sp. PtaU1.Bin162]|nr:MAG: Oxygen regulatory protein NreC [Smithella sp. PtaU1.Bin162]